MPRREGTGLFVLVDVIKNQLSVVGMAANMIGVRKSILPGLKTVWIVGNPVFITYDY